MTSHTPYNPLDKENLGASVTDALLACPLVSLPPDEPFEGAGVYAIYYRGDHQLYAPITGRGEDPQCLVPIYVGKAIPAGGRKGVAKLAPSPGKVLFKRLREHGDSIRQVSKSGLNTKDFSCRYLVVDDIWIPLGESLLITRFKPVWNNILDGFGNHDPGRGRYKGKKSKWDIVHPGRPWAKKCSARTPSKDFLENAVKQHFDKIYRGD